MNAQNNPLGSIKYYFPIEIHRDSLQNIWMASLVITQHDGIVGRSLRRSAVHDGPPLDLWARPTNYLLISTNVMIFR